MQALLSFDNAPPLSAPFRFFLMAPLFLALAGLLIAFAGPGIFASRWVPATLAVTHLLTIGFMLQIMLGALIQILPVVAGANLAQPLRLAAVVYPGLSLGALGLAAGFTFEQPGWLSWSALLLGLTVSVFLAAAGWALWGVPSSSPTICGLKLALFGLAGVLLLGLLLAFGLAHGWAVPWVILTDLHAGWGLGAWAGVLLAAMAYVVVPMFQLTPGYPAKPSYGFPIVILALLVLWGLAVGADWPWLVRIAQGLLAMAGIAFASLTLRLQSQRRRARADVTYRYWQLGLLSASLALTMLTAAALWPSLAEAPSWTLGFGALLIAGGFVPFIIGMLSKIIPFLAWLHLQNCGQAKIPAPNMNRILADADMQQQFKAYVFALALLLAACMVPEWLARPAGLALALAGAWLWWNLLAATRFYRQQRREIVAKLAQT